jgi:predicted MFS family arabinose efflux permease
VAGVFALMAASQCLFVTFGTWLKDTFGLGAAALSAVTFALGGVELVASVGAARRADARGKEASAALGAALMVPAMGALALWHGQLGVGIVLLAIILLGFEFAIVSALPIGTQLIEGAPARGLGLMLGAGTLGRALTSIAATRLYTAHGIGGPMFLGVALAAVASASFSGTRLRRGVAARVRV